METEATVEHPEAAASAAASPETPVDEATPSELGTVRAELEAALALADENQRKYLMALADLDNFRKLTEKRTADRLAQSKKSTISKFLPVADNLQRALAFNEDSAGLRGGLQATMRGFEALLASESITTISVVGAPFDPRTAEAIATRESADHDDEIVLEEVERGYQLGDELLRPAKVIVARRV